MPSVPSLHPSARTRQIEPGSIEPGSPEPAGTGPPDRVRPVLVVIGPSAVGKSAVVEELHRRGAVRVAPTWTTRPRRPGEGVRGAGAAVEHRFVTDEAFDQRCAFGFFAAVGKLRDLPHRYGLPNLRPAPSWPPTLVIVRATYVPVVREVAGPIVVYAIEDSFDAVRARLVDRGTSLDELAARLAAHDGEVAAGREVADRVFGNQGSLAELADRVAAAVAIDVTAACGAACSGGADRARV